MKQIWYPSANLIAGLAHFGWGAMIVFAFTIFGHPWVGVFFATAFAACKEFIFDTIVEADTFKDNSLDFSEYAAGIIFAVVVVLIAAHYRRG